MHNDICTIPVNDIFVEEKGCPICRLRNMLEDRIIEYTLGAAMMEPDIRISMNELGFCETHLKNLLHGKNRLPLALILETHLQEVSDTVFKKGLFGFSSKKSEYNAAKVEKTCYICDKVEKNMEMMLTTIYNTYNTQLDFREMFRHQEFLCLPHYRLLLENSSKNLQKKPLKDFQEDCLSLTSKYLNELQSDVHNFASMFDYRNSSDENKDFGSSKDSLERSFEFLCSRKAEKE